jgi:hypothetical protein
MSHRVINSAWRWVLITLLFVLGTAAMFQLYQGMLDVVSGHWQVGIPPVVAGVMMASAVYWLAKNRGDLVDA